MLDFLLAGLFILVKYFFNNLDKSIIACCEGNIQSALSAITPLIDS